ncbi:tRNA lysidine(34) synthetase TilS [Canibacter zhoujuaniae]|uniref:tRNA lysidine(34) synthetase TilS n=1 Tax=Canibacter zhoujuaniae TaxID=2708343 RepID=UPI00141D7950|nr:tRNA lysidine(34) synthetase TilS [Canibacter zhoujuaniae]
MGGKLAPVVAKTRNAVRKNLPEFGPLVVALSGGADSLALAAAVAFEAPRRGLQAHAVVVDHQLQPDSARIARVAAQQASDMGLISEVQAVEVTYSGKGIEADARRARYAALADYCAKIDATALFTGHTKNDQTEQVLLGLVRGSGTRALSGIAPERGIIKRPFLRVTRAETEAACQAQGLSYWSDPHNEDPRYTRVRVRQTVLPVFTRELGSGVIAGLARSAQLAREDADALDLFAAKVLDALQQHDHFVQGEQDTPTVVPIRTLESEPRAIAKRVLRQLLIYAGAEEVTFKHTEEVMALLENWHGQQMLQLPGVRVWRQGKRLFMLRVLQSAAQ